MVPRSMPRTTVNSSQLKPWAIILWQYSKSPVTVSWQSCEWRHSQDVMRICLTPWLPLCLLIRLLCAACYQTGSVVKSHSTLRNIYHRSVKLKSQPLACHCFKLGAIHVCFAIPYREPGNFSLYSGNCNPSYLHSPFPWLCWLGKSTGIGQKHDITATVL